MFAALCASINYAVGVQEMRLNVRDLVSRIYSFPRGIQRQPNNAMRFKIYVYSSSFFLEYNINKIFHHDNNISESDGPRLLSS